MNTTTRVGVALTKCYFCGESDRILINKLLTKQMAKKVESANGKVIDMEPCAKCADFMEQGIILLTIDDSKSDPGWNKPGPSATSEHHRWMPNPYRTGGFFVVKEEALTRMLGEAHDFALKHRWIFIEHEVAEKLGLFNFHVESGTCEQPRQ
jgi:hypothetical protein